MTPSSDIKGLVEALDRLESVSCRKGECICPIGQCDADTLRQALASISSREEDEDEGITQLADDPRVQEALRYLEARNFVLVNRQSDDPTPVRQLIAGRLSAPATQAEREAVATVLISYDDHTDWPVALEIAGEILSLLESRRTPPLPRPLTALLTRWDNGESVGDLITQYLRGEGDWGPVRVLVGATTRSPSTLPDGWRERVKTALREHHRRVYNEYGAFWFDGELDQMADAIGEVFATGDISKVMEENARLIATVAALKAADAERAEGLAKVQGYRADAEARVRELEEALEPFADFGDFMESETEEFADLDRMNLTPEESECVLGNLFVGAFRRARSLLSRED